MGCSIFFVLVKYDKFFDQIIGQIFWQKTLAFEVLATFSFLSFSFN